MGTMNPGIGSSNSSSAGGSSSSSSSSSSSISSISSISSRWHGSLCGCCSSFPPPSSCLLLLLALFSSSILLCLHMVEDVAGRTKTVAGHNLEPTPWHPFLITPNGVDEEEEGQKSSGRYARASRIFRCSYLTCPISSFPSSSGSGGGGGGGGPSSSCPSFFRWIHQDLAPWRRSRISASMVAEAQRHAAMRVVIMEGRHLYVDLYYACVQSRAMFTIWGLLQLLRRYPGMLPDVDLMFDCMDRPAINRSHDGQPSPPPLFRYCTTKDHFDIPFPDWSFWGWPEVNIKPWDEEFRSIKLGSQAVTWMMKDPIAYWKGNPDVQSHIRMALLHCNNSKMWGSQIMRQDWAEESRSGFQKSKLSNQCNHRYKIYAEGYAWSVSLKYILACGSLALIIHPQYEDFFSRGLIPRENYWPISATNLCQSIKFAVDWGNEHPSEAEAVGERGQAFMQDLDMDQVYDYMYHLIVEYSKLQDFKPAPPPSAYQVCAESLLCFTDKQQRKFLESSYASPSSSFPCTLPP